MGFGPPPGSPFSGPGAAQTSAAAGLPFAGMPHELAARAKRILEGEPDHDASVAAVTYSPLVEDPRRFTLGRFLAPSRWGLVLAFALVLVETAALQAGPLLTKIGIDHGVTARRPSVLVTVGVAYAVSIVANVAASSVRVAYTGRLGEALTYRLRLRVFAHLQRLGLDYYTDEKQGRLLTRMTSDIDALTQLFTDGLVNMAVQGLTLVLVGVVLVVIDPLLALVTLVAVVPAMTALTLWFRAASDRTYTTVRDRIADVLADLSENLSGMRVVSALGRRRENLVQHTNLVGEHRDANVAASKVGAIYGPASEAVGVAGQVLLLAIGGKMVLDGRLTVGTLFAFLLYLTSFFAPIQQLVQLYNTYQQGRAAVAKLADLLATPSSTPQRADARPLPAIEGRIELRGVTFGYTAGRAVLHEIDIDVQPGEVVAVVGPTGAGKSTVAKLVTRFYDPWEGSVRIDGTDLRDVTLASLRSQLGVVPQEPYLFGGTLGTNVSFGRPDATPAAIDEAVDAVGLRPLVDRLADGLDTPVHERGVSLSAGERQLLALARAFLARPRVLVLDEATSNLDLQSEQLVEAALDRLLEGRTAIIIAHRLATARRADRIIVVDGGRVVESGPHDELIRREGRYAAMFAAWVRNAAGDAHPAGPPDATGTDSAG
ncbi:MAG: ABC transporter ATP-binding protein/permease [Acidimicrobiia bacterium]|nr:ABC transporter ATP-binding protein/permease [Acidimicrobiia bacterium]